MPVIGFLNSGSADGYAISARAFRQGLKETKSIAKSYSRAFQILDCTPHALGYRRAVWRICSSGRFPPSIHLKPRHTPGAFFCSWSPAGVQS
jgi:hypothetical protein